jgi:hypothetical protein
MNSMRRGAPEPVAPSLTMLVMRPKLDEVELPDGFEKIGWLARL